MRAPKKLLGERKNIEVINRKAFIRASAVKIKKKIVKKEVQSAA